MILENTHIFVIVACLLVVIVLMIGLGGFAFGGDNGSVKTSKIDVVTISSRGNAVRFGDLNRLTENCRGNIRSATRGIAAGGRHAPGTGTDETQYGWYIFGDDTVDEFRIGNYSGNSNEINNFSINRKSN